MRLVYEKYKGCEDIITIDLHNGYSIIAIKSWDRDTSTYAVELRLKQNTIEKWDLIEKAESLEFNTTRQFINSAILKEVSTLLSDGFFDYYIKRNKYEIECYNKGFELLDNEGMGVA